MKHSDLPFGSEFSPSQLDLPRVLELAHEHGGDWRAFETAIRVSYFDTHQTSEYNRAKLANNTKLGMIAYGLLDREARLTEVGQRLYTLRQDEHALYREFARHILLHLHGITLVQCVLDIETAGEVVDLVKLREWLTERGIHFPRGGKHPSMMRLWLHKAGIFTHGWQVDQQQLQEVLGMAVADIEILAMFSPEQQAYLKTLANLGGDGAYLSNEVEKLATATFGIKFNEKNLPKQVLYPLAQAGYIHLTRGTSENGRGAKPFLVTPTAKLQSELIEPLLTQFEQQTAADLRPLLRKPLREVVDDLSATNTHLRGLALEVLAFKLMRLLDLHYMATRLRGNATAGAEVDVIFESSRLIYSRWQIQCKHTDRVKLDDVAKEVGLTHFLKSNVIVMVTTGSIGPEARRYANRVMADSNLCIAMVDGSDIAAIIANPTLIVEVMNREARQAMRLKTLEL